MKVYITKHVLTDGIQEREAELCDEYPKMVSFRDGFGLVHIHKPDWHLTIVEAKRWALKMVGDKLRSLEIQQAELLELRDELKRIE